jgi:hypothetical protein
MSLSRLAESQRAGTCNKDGLLMARFTDDDDGTRGRGAKSASELG